MNKQTEILFSTAVNYFQTKNYTEAKKVCKQILKKDNKSWMTFNLLGIVEGLLGNTAESIVNFKNVIKINPNFVSAYGNLGSVYRINGHHKEAVVEYKKALKINQKTIDILNNLASLYLQLGNLPEAIEYYKQVANQKPNDYEALNIIGCLCGEIDRFEEASAYLEKVIALKPDFADAYSNLGETYRKQRILDKAIESCEKAIELKPDFADAYNNLGACYTASNNLDKAIESCEKAIELKPDFADAIHNLALAYLKKGNYEKGLPLYESRYHQNRKAKDSVKQAPLNPNLMWAGQDLKDKTILIYPEQGFGDEIQFIRYVYLLKDIASKVVVLCKKELKELFESIKNVLIMDWEDTIGFDYWIYTCSLPLVFKTNLQNIPNNIPYLFAKNEKILFFNEILKKSDYTKKVGLVWAGNSSQLNDKNRSIDLMQLLPLFKNKEVLFVSLQKGNAMEQTSNIEEPNFFTIDSELNSFSDTAALIMNLDLVITVDTSIAHLAGALGKPTWVLLPYSPDWRWLLDRQDSPWYPNMYLFRQSKIGEWKEIVKLISQKI